MLKLGEHQHISTTSRAMIQSPDSFDHAYDNHGLFGVPVRLLFDIYSSRGHVKHQVLRRGMGSPTSS